MAITKFTINAGLKNLQTALTLLRVWETQWQDLAYGADDARSEIPDDEIPQDIVNERDLLRSAVVLAAAKLAGETEADARVFADTPMRADNPYNLDRVRLACVIAGWRLSS